MGRGTVINAKQFIVSCNVPTMMRSQQINRFLIILVLLLMQFVNASDMPPASQRFAATTTEVPGFRQHIVP